MVVDVEVELNSKLEDAFGSFSTWSRYLTWTRLLKRQTNFVLSTTTTPPITTMTSEAYFSKGIDCFRQGNYDEALQMFNQVSCVL